MADPEKCRFAKTHEWILIEGGTAVVGISDHAQKEITDVVFVELPKKGRQAKAGESVAVVESVKAAFDIFAPAGGEVVEVNDVLAKEPALVNSSPYDKGWLFKLKLADLAPIDTLMTHAQYQEFLKSHAAH